VTERGIDEKRLDVEARVIDVELRQGEAWIRRADRRSGAALKLLQDLKERASSLPSGNGHLVAEIEILERELTHPGERQEIERLLADASRHCRGGKPSRAVQLLDEAGRRLHLLPREGFADLYEGLQRLRRHYEERRRPALERFRALMESFGGNVAPQVRDLRRLSGPAGPLPQAVLRRLFDQVVVAQGILASLDPFLIGCGNHEAAARTIEGIREVLSGLLQAGASAAPNGDPGPPPLRPPAPAPVERRAWELSSWATGSWGTPSL
jgi:hypothetical protein